MDTVCITPPFHLPCRKETGFFREPSQGPGFTDPWVQSSHAQGMGGVEAKPSREEGGFSRIGGAQTSLPCLLCSAPGQQGMVWVAPGLATVVAGEEGLRCSLCCPHAWPEVTQHLSEGQKRNVLSLRCALSQWG